MNPLLMALLAQMVEEQVSENKKKEDSSIDKEAIPVGFANEEEALAHASAIFKLNPGDKILLTLKGGLRKAVLAGFKAPYVVVLVWDEKEDGFMEATVPVTYIMLPEPHKA